MEVKPNPFSLYDFLGYLIPGAIFIYSFAAIVIHSHQNSLDFQDLLNGLSLKTPEAYIPLVLASYVLGHILSFLSSLTVERFSIWTQGYPSKYLLKKSIPKFFVKGDVARNSIRIIVGIFLAPISFMEWLFGGIFKLRRMYARPLDSYLHEVIEKKLNGFCEKYDGVVDDNHGENVDRFTFAYHYAVENAPHHLPKMQNYVALYGFLRTLAFISVLAFWDMVFHACAGYTPISISIIMIISGAILSYTLFVAFVKFYRRFSLEALMAMAVIHEQESAK